MRFSHVMINAVIAVMIVSLIAFRNIRCIGRKTIVSNMSIAKSNSHHSDKRGNES